MIKIAQALTIAFQFCGQQMPDEAVKEMAIELASYPEADVLIALKRCRSELKTIKYSDILDRIPSQHPGVEQAWALVSSVMNNEQLSVCWSEEMREAYGAAAPLADDKVAARMAFKETYTRLIGVARAAKKLPTWAVSLGFDKSLRDECVKEAQQRNLITQQYAQKLLVHDMPKLEAQKFLEGPCDQT